MKLKINEVDASFWKRVIAYIIDAIMVNIIIMWPFQNTINKLTGGIPKNNIIEIYRYLGQNQEFIRSALPELLTLFLIISILTIAYWAALEYKARQSIGKMLMKIYVKSEGKELKLKQCIVRNITKISGLLLLIDCIGIISNNQRYFERMSKTRVVEKRFVI